MVIPNECGQEYVDWLHRGFWQGLFLCNCSNHTELVFHDECGQVSYELQCLKITRLTAQDTSMSIVSGGFWQARFCLSIMTVETSTLTYIVFCDGQTKIHREVMSTIMVTVHRFNFIRGERTSSFSSASIADGLKSRLTAEIKFYPTLPLRRKLFLSTSSLVNLMIQLTTPISHHASELPGIDRRICYIEDRHYGTVVAVFRGRP